MPEGTKCRSLRLPQVLLGGTQIGQNVQVMSFDTNTHPETSEAIGSRGQQPMALLWDFRKTKAEKCSSMISNDLAL
jgi:hypothetical protein